MHAAAIRLSMGSFPDALYSHYKKTTIANALNCLPPVGLAAGRATLVSALTSVDADCAYALYGDCTRKIAYRSVLVTRWLSDADDDLRAWALWSLLCHWRPRFRAICRPPTMYLDVGDGVAFGYTLLDALSTLLIREERRGWTRLHRPIIMYI